MAKLKLHSTLKSLHGALDGLVIKNTPHGQVLARRPDMSRVRWSPAQKAHRQRMQDAALHYRRVMADPVLAARCVAKARRMKVPVSSLVMGAFLKNAKSAP
jgi:hypothetical protein